MLLKDFILDLLFPIECLGCGKEKVWLCEDCLEKISLNKSFRCPVCQNFTKLGETCSGCQDKTNLNGVFVAGSYKDELLQKSIRCFKYNYISDLAKPLGGILVRFLTKIKTSGFFIVPNVLINYKNSLIVPVPLHKKRLRSRGFNQAELLAIEVSDYLELKIIFPLERKYFTKPQVNLTKKYRQENIKGVFSCSDKEAIKDKKIILIDDVVTTASTLNECAKQLKLAGAREVWGLVLARD